MKTAMHSNEYGCAQRNPGGFTLIEMLVVIAIIAVVAAILFPVFAKAREKARQTTCLSNMKQLSLAVAEYTIDYDDHFPNQVSAEAGDELTGAWIYYDLFADAFDVDKGSLYPYVKDKSVYICRDDVAGTKNGLSYSMNGCVSSKELPDGGFMQGIPPAKIVEPSNTMLFGEEASYTLNDPTSDPALGTSDDGYFNVTSNGFSTRHTSGSIISFVDGHAKWYTPSQARAAMVLTGGAATCL